MLNSTFRVLVVLPFLWIAVATAQQTSSSIDPRLAQQYFRELKALSDKDAGSLWGIRVYGPTFFADPETQKIVANQPDKQGRLHAEGGVFVGQLPPDVAVANTSLDWAGVHWTMIEWPLPENRRPRKQLMAHESFHRIQAQLRLEPQDANNNHLDGRIGRTWLLLEWRALTKALATTGAARRGALEDALYFRRLRRTLIPEAVRNEDRLEMNEGLAEYTGVKLSARYPQEAALVASVALWLAPNRSPFVRNFAYVSGPAYGILLDQSGISWRRSLHTDSDFGALLARAYHIALSAPTEDEAISRAQKYDGDEVIAQEKEREARQQEVVSKARQQFLDGPVLVLPVGSQFRYGFDPNQVTAISETMSLYEGSVQVSDTWGTLKAPGGALMVRENGRVVRVQVPAPTATAGRSITGQGWSLELASGWSLVPGARAGNWTVKESK